LLRASGFFGRVRWTSTGGPGGSGGGSASRPGDKPPQVPAGLSQDGPILADFLASSPRAPPPTSLVIGRPVVPPPSGAQVPFRQVVLPSASQPLRFGRPGERRLVAAALRPAEAVRDHPRGEQQGRPRLDGSVVLRRPLQQMQGLQGLQRLPGPTAGQAPDPSAFARRFPASTAGLELAGGPSLQRPGSASLRKRRLRARAPRTLRQTLCRSVLGCFMKAGPAAPGATPWARPVEQQLTLRERNQAVRHAEAGDVAALVRHLASCEERATWPPTGGATSASGGVLEHAVLRLFLDRRLAWPQVRALLGPKS